MVNAVEGVYKDGKVELAEPPQGVSEARVIVFFIPNGKPSAGTMLMPGIFPGPPFTDEEDFKIAEWHGPKDLGE